MNEYTRRERAFVQYSKLEIVDESIHEDTFEKFSIGVFGEEQEQIFIVFYTLAGVSSVKLEAEAPSWDFLYECQDILEKLSRVDKHNIKPEDIYTMLVNLGIKDVTNQLNDVGKGNQLFTL